MSKLTNLAEWHDLRQGEPARWLNRSLRSVLEYVDEHPDQPGVDAIRRECNRMLDTVVAFGDELSLRRADEMAARVDELCLQLMALAGPSAVVEAKRLAPLAGPGKASSARAASSPSMPAASGTTRSSRPPTTSVPPAALHPTGGEGLAEVDTFDDDDQISVVRLIGPSSDMPAPSRPPVRAELGAASTSGAAQVPQADGVGIAGVALEAATVDAGALEAGVLEAGVLDAVAGEAGGEDAQVDAGLAVATGAAESDEAARVPPGQLPGVVVTTVQPEGADPGLVLLHDPAGAGAASYRALFYRVEASARARTLMVTTSSRQETSTLCAANLALAIAEAADSPVLLVEACFSRGRMAPLFGVRTTECFGHRLARHRRDPDAAWNVLQIHGTKLYLLALGVERPPALDTHALGDLLLRLSPRPFSHVVLAGPPAVESSDAPYIAGAVDAVIMAVTAGATKQTQVRRAAERLDRGRLAGFALLT